MNQEPEWVVTVVPDHRIIDDALWQAVKQRQSVISNTYANVTEAVRAHHQSNRLNGVRRPKSLLSGLIFCGSCGGPYSLRGADRFPCSNHISNGTCTNTRTIPREELERRVLAGLRDRMMAPEIAAKAMHAYATETNRLNRERRSCRDSWNAELEKTDRALDKAVDAILAGVPSQKLKDRMETLEARKAELICLVSDVPKDVPDLLPSASAIYSRKVTRLTEALNCPEERTEAAEVLRTLIEKIVLRPGPQRGEIDALFYGELGTILNWIERQAAGKSGRTKTPAAMAPGVSVSLVAGAGFEPAAFRL